MEELSVSYFRNLLSRNIGNLENNCKKWADLNENPALPEEVHDEIRTTIGLTHLLMQQKLKQFEGLIDDSEFKRGEKEITCADLQGFWDMVYNEVEKIQKCFQRLENCKENQWMFEQEEMPKIEAKKKFPTVVKTVVSSQKHASAARQRLAEAKLKMKMAMQNKALSKATNDDGTKKTEMKKLIREEEAEEIKGTKRSTNVISNITNKQKYQTKGKSDKIHQKIIHNIEKENIVSTILTDSKQPAKKSKKEKPKDFIPLACITRSAKRAMLEKQRHLVD